MAEGSCGDCLFYTPTVADGWGFCQLRDPGHRHGPGTPRHSSDPACRAYASRQSQIVCAQMAEAEKEEQ